MKNTPLLKSELALRLYHETAKDLPLIDYHNHLAVADLQSNRKFTDIAEVWLLNDPYKHRAMRICGENEQLITGSADNMEKFRTWCTTYPKLIGGPLYDWSKLEMEELFGIDLPICAENADKIWDAANDKLLSPEYSARGIYNHFNVEYAAPCAALTDDLSIFGGIYTLVPSMRGDDLLCPSVDFIAKLSALTNIKIKDTASLLDAISMRLDAFHAAGCRFSDHALDNGFSYLAEDGRNDTRFKAILTGEELTGADKIAFTAFMLRSLAAEYAKRGWTLQLHIGAQRFTSTRLRIASGGAGGFAAIGNSVDVVSLVSLLDDIEKSEHGLPKIILFTLNPADNALFSVLSGSFQGVMQGPAWWWCDHLQGMREMLNNCAVYGVLSTFPGMTTDSRSLLSLLRHDYFREMFCAWVAEKVEHGEFPRDEQALKTLVEAICYKNAKTLISK